MTRAVSMTNLYASRAHATSVSQGRSALAWRALAVIEGRNLNKETAGGSWHPRRSMFRPAIGERRSVQTRMCSPVADRVPGTSAVAPSPLSTMLV
jgi:hypothetical protein